MEVSAGLSRPFPWRRIITSLAGLACIAYSVAFAITTDLDYDGMHGSPRLMRLAPVIPGVSGALAFYLWGSPIGSRAFGFRLTPWWRWRIAWLAGIGWFAGMIAVSGWIVEGWSHCSGAADWSYWKLVESGAIPRPQCGDNPARNQAYVAALVGLFAIPVATGGVRALERRSLLKSRR